VGILAGSSYSGLISDNLLYANTSASVLLRSGSSGSPVLANNTIYQPVGDAVRVENGSKNVRLRNNILYVLSG
jgi:hypothetical protein